jgi:opacity protein-like surface antigen
MTSTDLFNKAGVTWGSSLHHKNCMLKQTTSKVFYQYLEISMKRIVRDVVFSALLLSCFTPAFPDNVHIIYGFEEAHAFHGKSGGEYYIQAGSFLSKAKATRYGNQLQSKTSYPVRITQKANFNVVSIGPLPATEVRTVANGMLSNLPASPVASSHYAASHRKHSSTAHQNYAVIKETSIVKPSEFTGSDWFVSFGLGMQKPQSFNSNMRVNNASGFPAPYNTDLYSTSTKAAPAVAFEVGHRWERENRWLSAVALSLAYQNVLASNAGGTVMQYSAPAFINYNYNSYVSSNVVLLFGKVDLFRYHFLSSYFKVGIGGAFNRNSNYTESALPNVTPRTSPAYATHNSTQFAYDLGAGLDFQLNKQFILSAGYEYLNLGKISSGQGAGLWTGQSLNFGSYHTNEVFLSVSYLIGK